MRVTLSFVLAAVLATAGCSEPSQTSAQSSVQSATQQKPSTAVESFDSIYHGGDIPSYVEALGVRDGKIVFTGTLADAGDGVSDDTLNIDLAGKTLLPSFIDPHSHYMNSLMVADQAMLFAPPAGPGADVKTIITTLKTFAATKAIPAGELIIGYGYDDTVMPEGRLLNRDDLDSAFPDNPVRVDHVSMHGTVLNSKALEFYGINADTKTPPGGGIVRKSGTQEPYGLIM